MLVGLPGAGHLAKAGPEPFCKILLKCDRERELLCSVVKCETQALSNHVSHDAHERESAEENKKNEANTQREQVMGETEIRPAASESLVLVFLRPSGMSAFPTVFWLVSPSLVHMR